MVDVIQYFRVHRREHLTPEQIQHYEEFSKKVEKGDFTQDMLSGDEDEENEKTGPKETEHCSSLPPPPPTDITWEEYISGTEDVSV